MLAGGCETGWMYRAVEGQVHYWWVGLGNVIGSTILAYYWDDFAPALATEELSLPAEIVSALDDVSGGAHVLRG